MALATAEGTRRFAMRFAGRAAEGHFREAGELVFSSLGIGTYLGEPDAATDRAYREAVIAAVHGGVNVLDTAINYRFQRSERSIGRALAQLFAEGFSREELILCTKGGYLAPDGELSGDVSKYFETEYVKTGILRPGDVVPPSHCMTPRYLENQLARSLANLGLRGVDIYYLHNPESQLGAVSRDEFCARVRAAFEFLESAAAAGKIRAYGMATWNAFRQTENSPQHVELEEMAVLARQVAGDAHHFRFVQLPFNLAMPEAIALPNQMINGARVPPARAANDLGITLIASASLLQGQVARGLPPFVKNALGLESDLHRALQFARSAPGITTALVGMSRAEHVRENLQLVAVPPAPLEQFLQIFDREQKREHR
jgi:aryl-alcohol dehydrogenase-like predicted oxidoreductase